MNDCQFKCAKRNLKLIKKKLHNLSLKHITFNTLKAILEVLPSRKESEILERVQMTQRSFDKKLHQKIKAIGKRFYTDQS